ncbi:GAF and ANTAR domain-containing protein [Curtobacterium sp. MCPF17_002]|uniref:GAF and ANTAR domain-containing protein n=1 Tax=Curtobacterium sp. MCPF17_002 TaxID=2175645 RepID=UPI000DA97D6F|nr:GAF and ANTAR domain-containing protein [Curtobacterium sp. MCPF17_002]WIB77966.1 GAF and ANTAR domain-containing protein [Curtobacterium sp. MCPF17_002]
MSHALGSALAHVASTATPYTELSAPFLTLVPGDGASVATLGSFTGNESVSLTDQVAAEIDMVQFDLSEGPCWDALTHRDTILEGDFHDRPSHRWPVFEDAMRERGVGALFAAPATFGPFALGVVDVYAAGRMAVNEDQRADIASLAQAVGRRLLQRTLEHNEQGELPRLRRTLHQAAGIILAQVSVAPSDAFLLLQGHAFVRRQPVVELAEHLLAGHAQLNSRGELTETR